MWALEQGVAQARYCSHLGCYVKHRRVLECLVREEAFRPGMEEMQGRRAYRGDF